MVELYFIEEKFWLKTMLFEEFNLFAKQPFDKHYFFIPPNGFFCKEWKLLGWKLGWKTTLTLLS